MTNRSEAARKAWKTRRSKVKAKTAAKVPQIFSNLDPVTPDASEAAKKAWETRRAQEAEEETGRLEDIEYLNSLLAQEKPEEPQDDG